MILPQIAYCRSNAHREKGQQYRKVSLQVAILNMDHFGIKLMFLLNCTYLLSEINDCVYCKCYFRPEAED